MPLATGDKLGHYEILAPIGAGGMGEVYRAKDTKLGRDVALKILPVEMAQDHDRLARFQREASAVAALNHPNIVTLFSVEHCDGFHFLTTELVEGQSLDGMIPKEGFAADRIIDMASALAEALVAAHEKNLVHRDLKPANIMVTKDGRIKVLDFGLAKDIGTKAPTEATVTSVGQTQVGAVMGTPPYMSPEQISGRVVDHRSDIFSLGIILHEMTTGRRPFQGGTSVELSVSILRDSPPPITRADLPGELASLIHHCLAKDPSERVQSARILAKALQQTRLALTSGSAAWGSPRARRRFPTAYRLAAAGVLCTALLAAAWLFLLQHRAAPVPTVTPLTSYPGYEFDGALSPDSRQLAFVWDGETGVYGIYVKLIDTGAALRLTHGPGHDLHPAWSPDGRYIAFLRVTPESKAVFVVPGLGGAERRVLAISTLHGAWQLDPTSMGVSPGPAWSPDGKYLAIGTQPERKSPDCIYLVTPDGDQSRKLTSPQPDSLGDSMPAFSPDSRIVAFIRTENVRHTTEIFTVPAEGGDLTRVTFDQKSISGVAWASQKELLFTSNRAGSNMLWSVGARGGVPRLLAMAGRHATSPSTPARGDKAVYTDSFRNTNIWRVDLHDSRAGPLVPTRLIATSRRNDSPKYSPDGTRIVFGSDRAGPYEIWACKADGTDAVQLTSFDGITVGTPRWSPDGRLIAFDSVRDNRSVIYIIASDGGKPRLFMASEWDNMMPSWSRDGRFVYFASRRGNEIRVWKKALAGGDPIQVSHLDGGEALEAPGGQVVYYTNIYKDAGIWQVNADGTGEKPVPELANVHHTRYWDVTSRGIYFLRNVVPPLRIALFDFATRSISNVAEIPQAILFGTPNLSVSSDERFLLFTELDQTGSDIMSIENFR
jgi:Tol biopolymer transport system component